jgi:hypothetical protein
VVVWSPFIVTPPEAVKGVTHSVPTVLKPVYVYLNLAVAPYVGIPEPIAIPSIESELFIAVPVRDFVPEPESIKLL